MYCSGKRLRQLRQSTVGVRRSETRGHHQTDDDLQRRYEQVRLQVERNYADGKMSQQDVKLTVCQRNCKLLLLRLTRTDRINRMTTGFTHRCTQSAVMRQYIVCPSVCLSVTLRYVVHTGWNTSKIISRLSDCQLVELKVSAHINPDMGDLVQRNTPKLGWNRGGARAQKNCNISETVQDKTKVTMTDQ